MKPQQTPSPLGRLIAAMEKSARFAVESIGRARASFGPEWETDFSTALTRLYPDDLALEQAVKGYRSFVMDSMRRQKRFEDERRYPATTYTEVTKDVYLNDEAMEKEYLPGLLLSHYLWPHHYRQLDYFRNAFLKPLDLQTCTSFAEVGIGTGLYSRIALQTLHKATGTGFDISPMSLKFTGTHLARFELQERYSLRQQNLLELPSENTFDAVICVEVLEHLEDPVSMLMALKALCAPNGRLFVTAALNAAHQDHIYLYTQAEDVLSHVRAAGMHVEHYFLANAYRPAQPDLPIPAAMAMVLTPGG